MPYAEVAVNAPVARPRTFSYTIPSGMALEPGHAVWVPFGPRVLQGIVFAVGPEPSVEETRDIIAQVDPQPLLFSYQVELARWVAEQYLSSYFEAASLMLPPGFERKVVGFITPLPTAEGAAGPSLSSGERQVLNQLQDYLNRAYSFIEFRDIQIEEGRIIITGRKRPDAPVNP